METQTYMLLKLQQTEDTTGIPEKLEQLSKQPRQRRGKNPQLQMIKHQYDEY